MQWLHNAAEAKKTTKKHIIVMSLELFREDQKKKELAEGFKRIAQDGEISSMADDGLDDALQFIHQWES